MTDARVDLTLVRSLADLVDGSAPKVDEAALVPPPPKAPPRPERTLVLGAGTRLATVLRELDKYVAPGSETLVVAEAVAEPPAPANMRVTSPPTF